MNAVAAVSLHNNCASWHERMPVDSQYATWGDILWARLVTIWARPRRRIGYARARKKVPEQTQMCCSVIKLVRAVSNFVSYSASQFCSSVNSVSHSVGH